MKKYSVIVILLLLISCNNQSKKTNTENTEIKPQVENDETYTAFELTGIEQENLTKIQGGYYSLGQNENALAHHEKCEQNIHDIYISRKLDDMGFWEIKWLNETFEIIKVEREENGIKIYSEDTEYVFFLSKNKKDKVWDFGVLGYKDQTYLTRVENIAKFEIKPCTDIEKIMHEIPDTWFEISTIEGQEVIYEPCESAPGGITITTNTIDFWGGSDPYKIKSMTKLNNEVTIIYERHDLSESKIIFKEWNETILSIKIEDKNAVKHVSKEAKGNYPIIEEEC